MTSDIYSARLAWRSVAWLRLTIGFFTLAFMGTTWNLWWHSGDYPSIPWFAVFTRVPINVDRGLAIVILSSSLMLVWVASKYLISQSEENWTAAPGSSMVSGIWLASVASSVLLDQQRLQVWIWELFWLILFLRSDSPSVALRCCRGLVVSIYTYSAISKFDDSFLVSQGPWLWHGLEIAIGLNPDAWGETSTLALLAFPIGEVCVASLLWTSRTQRLGVAMSAVMHLVLLLILGPLGWDQRPGVLLWNLFFLVSVPVLFWPKRLLESGGADLTRSSRGHSVSKHTPEKKLSLDAAISKTWWQTARDSLSRHRSVSQEGISSVDRLRFVAVVCLCVWPLLEGIGWCDHWPAWAVYSSRPEIVTMTIPLEQVIRLPPSIRPHVGPPQPLSESCLVSIDQWSFQERNCPVYPQARYRLALARHLRDQYQVDLSVSIASTPDRWTGKRGTTTSEALNTASLEQRFVFGTQARLESPRNRWMHGELAIALSAQLAVGCYAAAMLLCSRQPPGQRTSTSVALLWTIGLLGMLCHVGCAFHFMHHWSHAAALHHTAARTAEVTGWHWGGGLYINYVFLGLWAIEAVRLWIEALGKRKTSTPLWDRSVTAVFLFMMWNATVVFGPWHWTIVCVVWLVAWRAIRWRPVQDPSFRCENSVPTAIDTSNCYAVGIDHNVSP